MVQELSRRGVVLCVGEEGKMKTQEKFDDERVALNERIAALEKQLSDMIQQHIDYMYNRERTHNMDCQ